MISIRSIKPYKKITSYLKDTSMRSTAIL